MLTIIPQNFIRYKFANSLFLGVSVGSIFTLYSPLEPSIYALGGVLLALGMLIVARLYHYILNAKWFFRISLFVEIILLLVMLYFLIFSYSYQSALLLYIGYQLTFVFGNYLTRTETLLLAQESLLSTLDSAKQLGYLSGMGLSYLYYKIVMHYGLNDPKAQVYTLHFVLIGLEVIVIVLIWKSFRK